MSLLVSIRFKVLLVVQAFLSQTTKVEGWCKVSGSTQGVFFTGRRSAVSLPNLPFTNA